MVPVVSYLLLRGRCRYCSAPIPKRVLLVEAGTGLLFLLAWSLHVASLHFLLAVLIASALIPVIVIGLEHRLQRGVRNGVRR
jgi:leader peptidase (prepilin peptidase)/N-methyltransferase